MKQYKDVKFDTVTVRMPGDLSIKLEAEAFMRNTTKAELVRQAVDAYLNGTKPPRKAGS
jgi:predicted DNA-binding protein